MFPENWHFNSRFVLKTTKTPVFVFITEILWRTFWRNKWWSVFDVVKRLRLCSNCFELLKKQLYRGKFGILELVLLKLFYLYWKCNRKVLSYSDLEIRKRGKNALSCKVVQIEKWHTLGKSTLEQEKADFYHH